MSVRLTGRERLNRIFQGKEVDRPALKLWGLHPFRKTPNPAYDPVTQLALATSDIFGQMGAEFHPYYGQLEHEFIHTFDEPCDIPHWRLVRSVYQTPMGDLTTNRRRTATSIWPKSHRNTAAKSGWRETSKSRRSSYPHPNNFVC